MLDRKFNIVQFQNSHSIAGVPNKISFETLVHFFQKNKVVTAETVAEYHAASREDKQKFKDKGCFIMGETLGNRRRISDIQSRSMITLDIDYCPVNMIDIIKSKIGEKSEVNFPFCYYTTHGHTPEKPRLRLIVPLSEDISPELYPPIGKAIAQIIGMEYFDATTFDVNRVMHVPSVSQDGEYLTEGYGIGKVDLLNPQDMLNRYMDYNNISEFQKPIYISGLKTAKIEQGKVKSSKKTKYKIVNAFNSAYSIIEAIDTFLPDVYEKSKRAKDRYSYLGGESKDGLVIMSEEYAFSHHGTDPAQGRLLNAFDIVKIHKFGKFDVDYVENDDFKEYEKSQSFEKMSQFVKTLPNVMAFMPVQKKLERNAKEFHNDDYKFKDDPTSTLEWRSTLDMVGKGDTEHPASNARNLKIIFENDEYLKDLFYYDGLKDTICFNRPPGWNEEKEKGSLVSDDDDSQIRVYLNSTYQIAGKDLIYDSVVHQASKKRIHPIRTFLANLPEWDGEERVETIICDLFDIAPNEFYREASKKWFVGLIERVMRPGSKFDMALTIIGEQGIGKSQFLKSLVTPDWGDGGMETFDTHDNFFSDTKIDFEKKDAYEQLVGVWLYELSEIEQYYTKSAVSVVKSFMSKTSDKYRKSYGRRVTEQKRQAVFAGTTNANKPLKDTSGNRRFLPFYSKMPYYTTRVYDTKFWTKEIRDQVLAEALFYFNSGYRPMSPFCKEAMRIWEELNEKATVENEMKPLIETYVENKFPVNFFARPLYEMQNIYPESVIRDEAGFTTRRETRNEFSIKEIWCILFKKDLSSTPDYRQREEIEKSLEELGFVRQPNRRTQGVFGQQTVYQRLEERLLNDDELPF